MNLPLISIRCLVNTGVLFYELITHLNYLLFVCLALYIIVRAILTKKIDTLNKRIFRLTLQGYNSPYDSLLCKVNSKSLYKRRLQTLLIILYKSLLFTHFRGYRRDLFSVRSTSYSLRDNYVFFLPFARSTLLMVYIPFRILFQNYGSLFQLIRVELLTSLILNAIFYSMTHLIKF